MEDAVLQGMLELTRKVFAGEIKRVELARRRIPAEVAFVGNAIMLVHPTGFLDDRKFVQGGYGPKLEELLSAGVVNRLAHESGFKSGPNLAASARNMELYRTHPGPRANTKLIELTPPKELMALLEELGCTEHVHAFLQDAREGVLRQRRWAEDFRERNGLKG